MEPKNLGGKSGDARFSTVSYLKKQHGVRELPDAVCRMFNVLTLQHFKEVLLQIVPTNLRRRCTRWLHRWSYRIPPNYDGGCRSRLHR